MYPHKVFSILYEHYHASFESRLCGDYGRLQQFWNQLEAVGCPRYNQHEIRTRANHKTHGIPIKIHGDGVVVTGCSRSWAKMVNAWTWSGLLASGSTIDNLWALAILYPLMVLNDAPGNAKERLWKELIWSFHWLWLGEWPRHDSNGHPILRPKRWLADGYFCVVWGLLQDMDFRVAEYGLDSYRSERPCPFCQCNLSDVPWTDFRPRDAPYIDTIWASDAAWVAAHPNRHWLFRLVGVGISAVAADLMHSKHLGTDKYFYGSVLEVLCYH